uniref:Uncharacterized protein n=1 Tax=Meloidogyne javanica TaxID=6303 RepID=A0A915N6P9_MELJA
MEEQSSGYEDYPRRSNYIIYTIKASSTLSFANLPEPLDYYPRELNDTFFNESFPNEINDSEGAFHTFDASRLTQLQQARDEEEGPSQLGHTDSFTFPSVKPKKRRQGRRNRPAPLNVTEESTSGRRGRRHEHAPPPSPMVDINERVPHGKCRCTIL